jgi:hypothetical protein
MKKNMNSLALLITKIEGGKINLPIAQVKELIRILAIINHEDLEYNMLFTKYGERAAKRSGGVVKQAEKRNAKR